MVGWIVSAVLVGQAGQALLPEGVEEAGECVAKECQNLGMHDQVAVSPWR